MGGFVGSTGIIEKEILDKMLNRIKHREPKIIETDNIILYCDGDSESILKGYNEYGIEMIYNLSGSFAFVIWDKNKKQLFGARDIFGSKPLYYTILENGELLFGSEIKSFLEHPLFHKEVNENALLPYLSFQYSAQEETFFKGVYRLPAAHYFTYPDLKIERYWDFNFNKQKIPFDDCVKNLNQLVNETVEKYKCEKFGAFLSGGVDSSYITAVAKPDMTFSVGFENDKFNETVYAKELSYMLGIPNHSKIIAADECFDNFSTIQYYMDEPQANPSSVPLYFLAKLARGHVSVVLSGEGPDEIFAGYEWYDESPKMRIYKKLPKGLRKLIADKAKSKPYFKGREFLIRSSGCPEDYFIGQAYIFPEDEAVNIVNEKYRKAPSVKDITAKIYSCVKDKDELQKKQYLDLNLWMPGDILLKGDRMNMAYSLDVRAPFLDNKVVKFAETVPSKYKITKTNTKYVFRKAAELSLPSEWANRKKMGFPVPIRHWLREEKYYNIVREYFTSDFAKEFFDTIKILKLLDDHFNGIANNGRKIWVIFTFLVWYKRFFIDWSEN